MPCTKEILNYKAIFYALLIVITISHVIFAAIAPIEVIVGNLSDDSFFYFEIAKNFAKAGVLTFDEIHQSNGFHPLWLIIITPVFKILKDKSLPIRFIYLVETLLLILCLILSYRIISNYISKAYAMIGILFCLIPAYLRLIISGMESGLTLFLLLVLFTLMDKSKLFDTFEILSIKKAWIVGIFSGLILLSRLDTIFIIGLIYIFMAFVFLKSRPKYIKHKFIKILGLLLPPFIFGTSYLTYNYIIFGHYMTISAKIKMDYSSINFSLDWWRNVLGLSLWQWRGMFPEIGQLYYLIPAIFGCLILLILRLINKSLIPKSYRNILVILTISYIIQLVNQWLFSTWRSVWQWYFYPSFILILFVTPVMAKFLIYFLRIFNQKLSFVTKLGSNIIRSSLHQWISKSKKIFLLTFYTLIVAIFILYFYSYLFISLYRLLLLHDKNILFNFKIENIKVAEFLNANTNKNAIIAMGDGAASLGYFLNRKLINLEGLVNDYKYMDYLHDKRLQEYLQQNKVGYLVVYALDDVEIIRGSYIIHKHTEPSNRLYNGPKDIVVLRKSSEIYRKIWHKGSKKRAYIIWKLT